MIVQPDLAQALQHCNQFRSLDAAKTVMQVLPALREHPEDVMNTSLQCEAIAGIPEQAWQRLTQQKACRKIAVAFSF